MRRKFRVGSACAAAFVALVPLGLAGCAAAADNHRRGGGPMGVDADVGRVLVRAVHVEPPVGDRYPAGADAIVRLTLFNEGDRPDALIAV